MASVFGLPCDKPPNVSDILFSTPLFPFSEFLKTFLQNPNPSLSKHEKFFNSKFFLLFYLYYIVFRFPREMSLYLHTNIGLNFSILFIVNVIFTIELFRNYGYECTLILSVILFLIYNALVYIIPVAATSPLGDVLPELKQIPASTRKPGLNHCRRLAICRATPVYDNFLFQKGKYQKCVECAKKNQNIVFKSSKENCGSKKRDIDPKECYECTDSSPPKYDNCTYSVEDCRNVTIALDILDPPKHSPKFEKIYDSQGKDTLQTRLVSTTSPSIYDRTQICKEAHGSLCWFGKLQNNKYRGWNYKQVNSENYQTFDLNDPDSVGQGFPTKDVCLTEMNKMLERKTGPLPEDTCIKGICDVSNKKASCSCSQYKDVPQFNDPCEFLEANCDEKSLAFTEAQLKMKQADVDLKDIVSVEDAQLFLNDLDKLSNALP
jgi:hypothetical protein